MYFFFNAIQGSYPVKSGDSGDIENNLKGHNIVMNPAVSEKKDDKANMKKAQRRKESAEREADEHWNHRSPGHDFDDEIEKPREKKGSSPLGIGKCSELRQKDTGNIRYRDFPCIAFKRHSSIYYADTIYDGCYLSFQHGSLLFRLYVLDQIFRVYWYLVFS